MSDKASTEGFEDALSRVTLLLIDLCIKHPWVVDQIKRQDTEANFSIDWKRLVAFIERLISEVDKMKSVYLEMENAAHKGEALPSPAQAERAAYLHSLEAVLEATRLLRANAVRSPRDPGKVEIQKWVFDRFDDLASRVEEFKP